MGSDKHILHYKAQTAFDLIEAISPLTGLIAANTGAEFLYRGVGSTIHRLLPKAFRGHRILSSDRQAIGRRTYDAQLFHEYWNIKDFCQIVDARGLRLPEDSQHFRNVLENCGTDEYRKLLAQGTEAWPPDELLSVAGLAQHYGIATRLLDWTTSPFVAAYFAAKSALNEHSTGKAAVWALDRFQFEQAKYLEEWMSDQIRIVTAPASDIPNLQAQQGCFLVIREKKFSLSAAFPRQPYDVLLTELLTFDSNRPALLCFSFPARVAGEVLALLARLGVDASSLFPGLSGAAEAIQEKRFWPRPDSRFEARARQFARGRHAEKWQGFKII